jgi:hypothetical protein
VLGDAASYSLEPVVEPAMQPAAVDHGKTMVWDLLPACTCVSYSGLHCGWHRCVQDVCSDVALLRRLVNYVVH